MPRFFQVGFDISDSLNISEDSWESSDDVHSVCTINEAIIRQKQSVRCRGEKVETESGLELSFHVLQFKVHTVTHIQTHTKSERSHPLTHFVIGSREGGCVFDTFTVSSAEMPLPSQPLHIPKGMTTMTIQAQCIYASVKLHAGAFWKCMREHMSKNKHEKAQNSSIQFTKMGSLVCFIGF